jgi:hypothetical protein
MKSEHEYWNLEYEDWLGSVVSGVSGEKREVLKTISRRYVVFSGRTEDQMRLLGPEAAHGYILGFFYKVLRRALYGHRVCVSFCDIFQCRNMPVCDLVGEHTASDLLLKKWTLEAFIEYSQAY